MSGIGVLGPVMIVGDDDAPCVLRGARPRLLLAVLASRLGRVARTDELVEALWGDDLPAHPEAALQSQVHRLRRQLGSAGAWVATASTGYRLTCPADHVDAARFERLLDGARARAGEPAVALADIEEALGLWRGPAYADVADHPAVRLEAARLEQLRVTAAEQRAEMLLAIGRLPEAVQAAEDLGVEHPYRERPLALRLRTLSLQGRYVDALRVFDEFRRRLGEELGVDPSPELRSLERDILRHQVPRPPAIGLPGNSFLGREVDLADAAALIERARLVTFTGPGGVGKTRLAAHVAARISGRFPDGVHRCELAPLADPDAVAAAVAAVLHVEDRRGRQITDRLVEYLRPQRALLLLDNCEHLLRGVTDLVEAVLARTPHIVVVATSRRRLGLEGEHVYLVRPLPAKARGDEPIAPTLTLFVDRASAVRRDLDLTDEDRATIGELCRRLDGLPLAVELAAARSLSRTPAEILAEISERLDLLADSTRRLDRHRSIEAAMSWSYELLDPDQRALLRRVSVFAGGWTSEAAAALVDGAPGEVSDVLAALAEHSLVTVETIRGRTRFSMLEPVRQYAQGRLHAAAELQATRSRHAAWAAAWLELADLGLRGAEESRWAAAIDAELANLGAAHRWCLAHDPATALRIVAALYWYAYWYGPTEVFGWADACVARLAATAHPHRAGAYATAAVGAWRRGDLDRARRLAEQGITIAEQTDPSSARFAWEALRSTELLAGRYDRALACRDRAMALARAAGDTVHEAHCHAVGALALGYLGRTDDAAGELAAAAALLETTDNPTTRALCDYVAGENRLDLDPAGAIPLLHRSRLTARATGNTFVAGVAGLSAVSCAARLGNRATIGEYTELIEYFHRAGAWTQLWTTIRTLIETLTRLRRDEPAAVLHGALLATDSGAPVTGGDAARLSQAVTTLRDRLGDDAFARLHAHGATLGNEGSAAYALRVVGATDTPGAERSQS